MKSSVSGAVLLPISCASCAIPRSPRPTGCTVRLALAAAIEIRRARAIAAQPTISALLAGWTVAAGSVGVQARDALVYLLTLVRRNSSATATELAARLERSRTWLNRSVRVALAEAGV